MNLIKNKGAKKRNGKALPRKKNGDTVLPVLIDGLIRYFSTRIKQNRNKNTEGKMRTRIHRVHPDPVGKVSFSQLPRILLIKILF